MTTSSLIKGPLGITSVYEIYDMHDPATPPPQNLSTWGTPARLLQGNIDRMEDPTEMDIG